MVIMLMFVIMAIFVITGILVRRVLFAILVMLGDDSYVSNMGNICNLGGW